MDYTLPRAGDMPPMQVLAHDVPSPTNPLGVKGAGEAGTTGALAATSNAVAHALRRVEVRLPDIPLTSAAIWQALYADGASPAPAGRFRDAPCVPTCRLEEIVTPDGDADPEFGELTVGVPCHEPLTPRSFTQCILVSTRFRRWYPLQPLPGRRLRSNLPRGAAAGRAQGMSRPAGSRFGPCLARPAYRRRGRDPASLRPARPRARRRE